MGARGGRDGSQKESSLPVSRLASKDGGRKLDWLTYVLAAAEGNGDKMTVREYGDVVGKLGVTEDLCVDL